MSECDRAREMLASILVERESRIVELGEKLRLADEQLAVYAAKDIDQQGRIQQLIVEKDFVTVKLCNLKKQYDQVGPLQPPSRTGSLLNHLWDLLITLLPPVRWHRLLLLLVVENKRQVAQHQ